MQQSLSPLFTHTRSSVNRGRCVRPSRAALFAHHQHGAMSMPHHRVRDAAHQGSPHTAAAPATHNYQPHPYLFAKCDYLRCRFSHTQVCLCDRPSCRPYLLDFLGTTRTLRVRVHLQGRRKKDGFLGVSLRGPILLASARSPGVSVVSSRRRYRAAFRWTNQC
jgi:hypothetical protein